MSLYAWTAVISGGTVLAVCLGVFLYGTMRLHETASRMEIASRVVAVDIAAAARSLRVAADQHALVRESLRRMEDSDRVVADNLALSVGRADATVGPDGAAADAALRTGDTASAIIERQANP